MQSGTDPAVSERRGIGIRISLFELHRLSYTLPPSLLLLVSLLSLSRAIEQRLVHLCKKGVREVEGLDLLDRRQRVDDHCEMIEIKGDDEPSFAFMT
jgi:hypothetical protein